MFRLLKRWKNRKFIIKPKSESMLLPSFAEFRRVSIMVGGKEHLTPEGLVNRHLYSLITAKEVVADGGTHRMICLRNPWGDHHEWKGRFSDKWSGWGEYPELKEALGVSDVADGLFWMCWNDFRESVAIYLTQGMHRLGQAGSPNIGGLVGAAVSTPSFAGRASFFSIDLFEIYKVDMLKLLCRSDFRILQFLDAFHVATNRRLTKIENRENYR